MEDDWQSLTSLLNQSQTRMSQWASEFEQILSKTINPQDEQLNRKISDLETTVVKKAKLLEKASIDQRQYKDDLKGEIEIATAKMAAKKKMLDLHAEELSHLLKEQQSVKKSNSTAPAADAVEEKIKSLEEEEATFRRQLGLEIIKVKGGSLQFIFSQIDSRKPDAYFLFSLHLTESRKYQVTDVQPDIADMDSLVEQLNSSNNLDRFVHAVRRAFKSKVEKN